MAAPLVVSVSPASNEADVVLGTQVVVTFDQEIDAATLNESTFSLTCPGLQVLTPGELAPAEPPREIIPGTFSFSLSNGRSVVRFNPNITLRKDTVYTVLVLGASGSLSSDAVKNLAGDAMADSYEWTFKTGALNVVTPPAPAPLPAEVTYLDPSQIIVIPRRVLGNDLAQEIQIIFPEEIEPTSVDLNALLVGIEPILGDLNVVVPPGVEALARVSGRVISIALHGWPAA